MQWSPGALVPGILIFVGVIYSGVRILTSNKARVPGTAARTERALAVLLFGFIGLALIGAGTPAPISEWMFLAAFFWAVIVGVAWLVFVIRRQFSERGVDRAAAELGTIPGPPRFVAPVLSFFATYILASMPLLVIGYAIGTFYAEAANLSPDRVSVYSQVGIFTGAGVGFLIAAIVLLIRYLTYRQRVKAHRSLVTGFTRRIQDERDDAYRAGFRDGKAASAVDNDCGGEL